MSPELLLAKLHAAVFAPVGASRSVVELITSNSFSPTINIGAYSAEALKLHEIKLTTSLSFIQIGIFHGRMPLLKSKRP